MAAAWRVGKSLGRALYLDDRCIGMLDERQLARAVVDGLTLLDELGEGDGGDPWRARLTVWRLRMRALRLEALRRRARDGAPPRARAARRAPRLARR